MDLETLLATLSATPPGTKLSPDEYGRVVLEAGRNLAPIALYVAWGRQCIDIHTLRAQIGWAWSGPELPESTLSHQDWLSLFTAAGYVEDDKQAARPASALRLFRGSSRPRRRRWSWTADREKAEWFAERHRRSYEDSLVWVTTVPPKSLLCANLKGREEQ